jgi:DNA-binding SARP family transcriptional activator
MANLNLGLLGSFRFETSAGVPVFLPTKRAKALLAYLALHPGKPQARSKLAALLWEDSSDDKALASLRQTLSALRKATSASGGDFLSTRGDTVLLAPAALDIDVERFERLIASSIPADLETADGLYQGEFLEGFELRSSELQRWIRAERERLHEKALEGLANYLRTLRMRVASNAAHPDRHPLTPARSAAGERSTDFDGTLLQARSACRGASPVSGLRRAFGEGIGRRARASNQGALP